MLLEKGLSKLIFVLGVFVSTQVLAVNYDASLPKNIQDQMTLDLAFMAQIQGSGQTKLHQQIFGTVDGNKYSSFFNDRIKTVALSDPNQYLSCGTGMAVACVISWFPNKMYVTENFIKFSHPQVARMMVVYHEARHSESDHKNWPHDDCPVPYLDDHGQNMKSIWTGAMLEGQPACDNSPLGSYGSSTILLKNISLFCSNCNDKVKMDADLYATDQLGRIDNNTAKQAMLDDFAGK